MNERPILMSAPMVQALLAGTKTQTRREVKPRHGRGAVVALNPQGMPIESVAGIGSRVLPCPYGAPGGRLWVREAWGAADRWVHDCETDPPRCVAYRADLSARSFDPPGDLSTTSWGWERMRWRPSIHMPRWACRIVLEVTGVRVERLQDISTADCWAEGIPASPDVDPVHQFRDLVAGIHGGPAYWDSNPWVWVVSFRRAG